MSRLMLHRLLLACLQVDDAPQKKEVDEVLDKIQTLMEEDDPQAAGPSCTSSLLGGLCGGGGDGDGAVPAVERVDSRPTGVRPRDWYKPTARTPVKIIHLEGTVPPYLDGQMAILDSPAVTSLLQFGMAEWIDMRDKFQASGGTIGSGGVKG